MNRAVGRDKGAGQDVEHLVQALRDARVGPDRRQIGERLEQVGIRTLASLRPMPWPRWSSSRSTRLAGRSALPRIGLPCARGPAVVATVHVVVERPLQPFEGLDGDRERPRVAAQAMGIDAGTDEVRHAVSVLGIAQLGVSGPVDSTRTSRRRGVAHRPVEIAHAVLRNISPRHVVGRKRQSQARAPSGLASLELE